MSEKARYDGDYPDSRIQKEQERAWGVIDELEANPQPELNANGGEVRLIVCTTSVKYVQ